MGNDTSNLLESYVEAAIGYDKNIREGNSKLANKSVDKIVSLFNILRDIDGGLDEVGKLLFHQNLGVRLWVSNQLLNYPKFGSIKVLESIKGTRTIHAVTARIMLGMWERGENLY
jgi:hypothetical protein